MSKVVSVFYTVQGEGVWAGVPAVFVRFAGCSVACTFCDTDYTSNAHDMTHDEVNLIAESPCDIIVATGGEPLEANLKPLRKLATLTGKLLMVETSGLFPLPEVPIDWITCSPKLNVVGIKLERFNELKVLYHGAGQNLEQWFDTDFSQRFIEQPLRYLQPVEKRGVFNFDATVAAVKADPRWRLSVQTHKWMMIP